jgi:hypothetical protein
MIPVMIYLDLCNIVAPSKRCNPDLPHWGRSRAILATESRCLNARGQAYKALEGFRLRITVNMTLS